MRSLCIIPMLAATAAAQLESIPPDIRSHIEALGDPSLEVRDAAAESLRADASADVVIDQAMTLPGLTMEQRLRLRSVARAKFFSRPLAGMGLSFAPDSGGIRVMSVVQDDRFWAHRFLQPGDLLIEVNGHRLITEDDLRSWILSQDPGDVLRVTFRRNVQVLHASIRLGRFLDLDNPRQPTSDVLESAWVLRSGRFVIETPEDRVIDSGLSPDVWDEGPLGWQAADDPTYRGTIAMGGEPTFSTEGMIAQDVGRGPTRRPNMLQAPEDPRDEVLRERASHIQAMQSMRLRLDEIERRLNHPEVTRDQQASLRVQTQQLRDRIRWYQQQIDACEKSLQRLR